MTDVYTHNQKTWNEESLRQERWSVPVSDKEVEQAKNGDWSIILTPVKAVPKNWFPQDLKDKKVLLVAGGGGQQTPILAAAGAEVTILDASIEQINKDKMVCEKHGLNITTILGDMQNMHQLKDESFDLLINPCSNCFIPDVQSLWKECFRVLKVGGKLMSGHVNPVVFAADEELLDTKGEIHFIHSIPYQSKPDDSRHIEFGHSLEALIGGQNQVGFAIVDFYDDGWGEEVLDRFMKLNFATLAAKL